MAQDEAVSVRIGCKCRKCGRGFVGSGRLVTDANAHDSITRERLCSSCRVRGKQRKLSFTPVLAFDADRRPSKRKTGAG